jgi:cell division protein FtsZ
MIFNIPENKSSIIKVLGVGGGGSNAVNFMFTQGITGVDFAICNTDNQAMSLSPVPVKIQLGMGVTEGRGAGNKPNIGRECCLESIDDVKSFFNDGTKMIFVTAGMGGGTGTGAAPVIAKAAKEMDILTVAIVTMPFSFEGKRRIQQATEGLAELKKSVDTLIVISNDKLRKIYGNLGITEAFHQADNILTIAAKGIAEIITKPGYVNIDFEDVNTVMRDSGVAVMGTAIADGDDRAIKAVKAALQSPLLEDSDIKGAKHILINITSGTMEASMDEITTITSFVQDEAGNNTDLIWGNCHDESLGDRLSVTVIATGFAGGKKEMQFKSTDQLIVEREVKTNIQQPQAQPKSNLTVNLDDEEDEKEMKSNSVVFEFNDDFSQKNEIIAQPKLARENIEPFVKEEVKTETTTKLLVNESSEEKRRRVGLTKIDNPEMISELENQPAYLRKGIKLDEVEHSNEQKISNWYVTDEDEPELKDGNSFLHTHLD